MLKQANIDIGDVIKIKTKDETIEGSLMPRYEFADKQHIVIKLKSGYNIGINISEILSITQIKKSDPLSFQSVPPLKLNPSLPKIVIIGTGGTIASKIDYRTGGVHPQFSAEELCLAVPEITKYAEIHTSPLFNVYSEHINADHWSKIAEKIGEEISEGYEGIVIAHGTDTMSYTSAALSFALKDAPVPIILVGSQRSTDRPSSDAALNLIGAVATASTSNFSGIYVAMHGSINDIDIAIHSGTKVRKNHSSRRDAFESIDTTPVAIFKDGKVNVFNNKLPQKNKTRKFEVKSKFEKKVALVKFHPSFNPEIIDYFIKSGYRGIVFEGTGLGHVSEDCYESIAAAVSKGILVGMTSQSIWGRVSLTVYDSGRDLLKRGVIPLGDMLSETALVKMMWVLGNTSSNIEAKQLMLENIVGEYEERSPFNRRSRS